MSLNDDQIRAILDAADDELSDGSEEDFISGDDSETEDANPSLLEEISSSSDSDEYDDQTENSNVNVVTSRDGTNWSKIAPPKNCRRSACNTLLKAPGLTNYSKNIDTPLSAFKLLFDNTILDIIINCSEKKAAQLNFPDWRLSKDLLQAFIGILITFGATRSRKESLDSVWREDEPYVRPIFKATMGRDTFKEILRFIRTDDHETRSERRSQDKLAAIREVWEIFTTNCQKSLIPDANMCVDEQMVGFRGKCPFRVYMKSKPDRYGIKIWAICENPSGYIWKSQVYTGKIASTPEKNQGKRVVLDLVEGLGQGYGVTCDNFFTSLDLARELKSQSKTLLGTLRKIRKEVPKEMLPSKDRQVNSSIFLFTQDVTMVSYVPNKNRAVLLLSTQHRDKDISTDEHSKPVMILDYNKTKGAVDSADKMLKEYSMHRISRRWPFVLLSHIINVCCLNAFILFRKKHPDMKMTRKSFLKALGLEMVKPHIERRAAPPRIGLNKSIQNAMQTVLGPLPDNRPAADLTSKKRGRCSMCTRDGDRKYSVRCSECSNFICPTHTANTVTLCANCHE